MIFPLFLSLFFFFLPSFPPAHREKCVSLELADGTLVLIQRAVSWVSYPQSALKYAWVQVCFRNPRTLPFLPCSDQKK